jgi:hypothetical protein
LHVLGTTCFPSTVNRFTVPCSWRGRPILVIRGGNYVTRRGRRQPSSPLTRPAPHVGIACPSSITWLACIQVRCWLLPIRLDTQMNFFWTIDDNGNDDDDNDDDDGDKSPPLIPFLIVRYVAHYNDIFSSLIFAHSMMTRCCLFSNRWKMNPCQLPIHSPLLINIWDTPKTKNPDHATASQYDDC